jgi:hypothetical protein
MSWSEIHGNAMAGIVVAADLESDKAAENSEALPPRMVDVEVVAVHDLKPKLQNASATALTRRPRCRDGRHSHRPVPDHECRSRVLRYQCGSEGLIWLDDWTGAPTPIFGSRTAQWAIRIRAIRFVDRVRMRSNEIANESDCNWIWRMP